jgi:hypothetical protein
MAVANASLASSLYPAYSHKIEYSLSQANTNKTINACMGRKYRTLLRKVLPSPPDFRSISKSNSNRTINVKMLAKKVKATSKINRIIV